MDYITNNNETNDRNDWRFMGQDEYLMNVSLKFAKYKRFSETWDHDHCDFCFATFSECENDLHEGYHTLDDKCRWICEKCFNDFKYMFNWSVTE